MQSAICSQQLLIRNLGTLPPTLARLPSLKYLEFDGTAISGTIPPLGGSLVKLKLERNRISGTIPSEAGGLAMLQDELKEN